MEITVKTKLISLLGDPLEQTFAPQMFNETFRLLNMDFLYFPIEVGNDRLGTIVEALRNMNYAGFNVTKPNKINILEHIDEIDELASKIGSVNVVTKKEGRLKGYNSDGIGFVQAFLEESEMDLTKTIFVIFGAGGASRALSCTLAFRGVLKLYIVDKIEEASFSLVKDINGGIRECAEYIQSDSKDIPELIRESHVLVNATGIGMYPDVEASPVDKKFLRKDLFVCDITYNPPRTRLLRDAHEVGGRVMNGVGMVINQGVRGFSLMTGEPEPKEIMREVMMNIINKQKH